MKKITILFLLVGAVAGGSIVYGQSLKSQQWTGDVQGAAMVGGNPEHERLAKAFQKAAGDPDLTKAAVRLAFQWEERAKPRDTSLAALQIMQNQRLIEQNEKIIALLTALNKKK